MPRACSLFGQIWLKLYPYGVYEFLTSPETHYEFGRSHGLRNLISKSCSNIKLSSWGPSIGPKVTI